ncbi:similar to Saccharomyces cerevisiae YPL109C Putative protein of unknown function [Maudiozyma saulgeensis]|uniref:ABC1 atypical kinase-like domain-containing protein n=1 Tax=Maudiozyma saulgeensis TaxID=1789683 RepID=A0A1X7R6B6_9SACH|nr:similar to Saccharomyces cerevisiae YPL109C Putative protein of unknown function [Kazachstania saulgeensis]
MFRPFALRSCNYNVSSKLSQLSIKRYSSFLIRPSSKQSRYINHKISFYILGTVAVSTSLYTWKSNILISNDQIGSTAADHLKGDPRADTYEMGLYLASQEEQRRNRINSRKERLKKTKSKLYRLILRLYFAFDDHIWVPLSITYRFLEITIFILPIIVSFPIAYFLSSSINTQTWWFTMIRMVLQSLGPSFIKLGQWAASRTDLFPSEFCRILGNLHSKGKPHSFKYTEKELCGLFQINSLDEVFETIDKTPVGVGAIAQVYIVKFNESFTKYTDGKQWFALKILHPHVLDKISKDLKIMKFGAMLINFIPTMEWLSLPDEVSQFSILMNLQLDLRIESLNLRKFRNNFENNPRIEFPEPLLKFSNTNILFEEHVEGLPMESFLEVKDLITNVSLCKKVSDPFVDAFLKMLILDDFIHADLHPGNVLIKFIKMDNFQKRVISENDESTEIVIKLKQLYKEDKEQYVNFLKSVLISYTPQIYFIDAGLVTELNDLDRVNFIDLFKSLVKFDGYRAGELMIERSRTPETAINSEEFAQKVKKLVSTIRNQTFTLGTVSVGNLLDQMLSMVRVHHVRMEADFVSVVVAILLLEGIGRQLDPNLDLFDSSIPILREYAMTRERRSLLSGANTFTMVALWLGLELRQWMNLSVKQIEYLVKTDQLCPNY